MLECRSLQLWLTCWSRSESKWHMGYERGGVLALLGSRVLEMMFLLQVGPQVGQRVTECDHAFEKPQATRPQISWKQ